MLLAEVVLLHEKTLLLAEALPRRRREEAVDNMVNSLWSVVDCVCDDVGCFRRFSFSFFPFSYLLK